MSKRIGDKFYIYVEESAKCEYCGKIAELRPYGKNGANICYECGMGNIETTGKMFSKRIDGAKTVILANSDMLN